MSKIESIRFEVVDPLIIKKTAGCEVLVPDMYSVENPDQPVKNGLFDLKMGTVDKKHFCSTCKGTPTTCPGHHGYIELNYPCYNPTFLEGKIINDVLKCICHSCGTMFDSDIPKNLPMIKRLNTYISEINQNTCKKCAAYKPNTVNYTNYEMRVKYSDDSIKIIDTETVLDLFKKLSQEQCDTLGILRPNHMIWTVLPVIPPVTRTHSTFGGISKSANELTTRYQEIISINNSIQDVRKTRPYMLSQTVKKLQRLVSSLTKPEKSQSDSSTGNLAPIKSMVELLFKKEGLIRSSLMGKRVNFSARTVVGLDITLELGEVGIPKFVASKLTTPERVTSFNIKRLQTLVDAGGLTYPGASSVELPDGSVIDLKHGSSQKAIFLQQGHIVHRYLLDGDLIFLNRQPSLHKFSMMGHRAKVLEGNTFRLNVSANAPYNADYDGDEVNMHFPQMELSKAELMELANISNLVIGTGNGGPIMSLVLDTLLGCFMLTLPDTKLSREDFMNIITEFNIGVFDNKSQEFYGRELIKYALGDNVYYKSNSKFDLDPNVVIENGNLLSGVLTKTILGTGKGELIHTIATSKGPKASADFITKIQRITNKYMIRKGHSVGIQDAMLSRSHLKEINNLVDEVILKVEQVLERAEQGIIKLLPGLTEKESLEQDICNTARVAVDYANSAINALSIKNNYVAQVKSGAKGDLDKLKNIMAIVGQLLIDGNRIKPGYTHRLIPHFLRYDLGLEARGFVRRGYVQGLTPIELFFIATEQREKIIDTGLKTATSGSLQRQMVKSLEGIKVEYDGSTRLNSSNIIQFVSGGDNFDISMVQERKIPITNISEDQLRLKYLIWDIQEITKSVTQPVAEYCMNFETEILEQCQKEYRHILELKNTTEKTVQTPFILDALITQAKLKFIKSGQKSNLNPTEVISKVDSLLDQITLMCKKTHFSVELDHIVYKRLTAYIKSYMSPKVVIIENMLSQTAFEWICENIHYYFRKALLNPGEMIGCLSALSLGEPLTQMTLNSVIGSTELLIKTNDKFQKITIGEFVEKTIGNNTDKVFHCAEKCTTWTESVIDNPEILSCDTEGNIKWCIIEGVSRHPIVNLDGTDTLIKVETTSGRSVIATKAKSFLKLVNGLIVDVNGSDLKEGDWLPVSKILATPQENIGTDDDFNTGFTTFGSVCDIFNKSQNFIKGHICGLIKTIKCQTFTGLVRMPLIQSKIQLYKNARQSIFIKKDKLYVQSDDYDLDVLLNLCGISVQTQSGFTVFNHDWIPKEHLKGILEFNSLTSKNQQTRVPNEVNGKIQWEPRNSRFPDIIFEKITKITEVSGEEYVYDLTVKDTRNFNLYSGLCQRDTFHSAGGGGKSTNTGVPRVEEIINVSRKILTPMLTIYFNSEHTQNGYISNSIINKIEYTELKQLVKNIRFSTTTETQSGYSNDIIIIELDTVKLETKRLLGRIQDIVSSITNEWGNELSILHSESDRESTLIIRYSASYVKVNQEIKHRFLRILAERVLTTKINGIRGINRVYINRIGNEPFIQTDGGMLSDILHINEIDFTRTVSNGIYDTNSVLGIEATRSNMISELNVAYGKGKVGSKHINLLVDTMTFAGIPMSVKENGIPSKLNYSTLSRCSVQMQLKYLGDLSRTKDMTSNTNGVTDAIFVGKMFRGGTGMCEPFTEYDETQDEIIDNFKLPNFAKMFTK